AARLGDASKNGLAAGQYCQNWFSPVPQYSASNRTVHWGVNIICNFTGTLHDHGTLYSVEGSGENAHNVWQDEGFVTSVGTNASVDRVRQCVNSSTGRWIVRTDSSVDGFGVVQTNTAWTTIFTISCADVYSGI